MTKSGMIGPEDDELESTPELSDDFHCSDKNVQKNMQTQPVVKFPNPGSPKTKVLRGEIVDLKYSPEEGTAQIQFAGGRTLHIRPKE